MSINLHEVERVGAASQWTDVTLLITDAAGWLHFVDGAGDTGGRAAKEKTPIVGVPFVQETTVYYLEPELLMVLDADLELGGVPVVLPDRAAFGPVLVGNVAVYATAEGAVVALDLAGEPLMRHTLDSPAAFLDVADDGVVVIDEAGMVSVVELPATGS